jgi:replicative DNA helicase
MADNERRLISRATYDTNYEALIDAGITVDMFERPDSRDVYAYAVKFMHEFRRSITPRVLREEFPKYKLLDRVDEPLGYYITKVRKEHALRLHHAGGDRWADALQDKDPDRASEILAEMVKATNGAQATGKTVNMATSARSWLDVWFARSGKLEIIGLPTGFRTIDRATLGLQKGQLITIAGLAGAGKSTLAMLMAQRIQQAGYSAFFMSFEMSEEEQTGRYIAMEIGVNYNDLIIGRISEEKKAEAKEKLVELEERSTFALCTDITRSSTISGLEAELRRYDLPDAIFIDGVYMMRDEQTKKSGAAWDAMTNITRDMKQLAQRIDRNIVMTTQALVSKTRKIKGGGHKLDMYSPGYSSSFAQDSDVMLGLESDDGRDEERLIRLMKGRHCPKFAMWVEWEWATSSFGRELGLQEGTLVSVGGDDGDDDYGDDDDA